MTKKIKTANTTAVNTAVTNPGAVFNNINLPQPGEVKKGPKITTVEVGLFRLPGVKLDREQFTEEQLTEISTWAKENGAYIGGEDLYSWKDPAKRDWFILRWS